MANNPDDFDLQRAIRQKLESLERSGVMQLRRRNPIVTQSATAKAVSQAAAPLPTTGPANSEIADTSSTVHTTAPVQSVAPPAATTETQNPNMAKAKRLSKKKKIEELELLDSQVKSCTLCKELSSKRTQTVFGVGNPNSRVVFFGEAPGADEDAQGEPFVGRAGKLLTKIIEACGFARKDVYILNTLKCRPPGNRNPAPDEVSNCRPFFERQLEIIQPEFIVCLGSIAAMNVLETKLSIGKLRGEFHDYKGMKVLATYHPAYLLRNPPAKKYVWDDMKILLKAMGLPIPKT